MNRDLRLALLGAAVLVLGLALGDWADPPPGTPCKEGTGVPDHPCEREPHSEGFLFLAESMIVAGLFMMVWAGARAILGRRRSP